MAATSAEVKALVEAEVGYHEGRDPDGNWNNAEKYAAQTPGLAWADYQPWCDVFANWAYHKAGVAVPEISAGCAESVAAFKKAGRWTEYPGHGFQALYGAGGGEHTGIVVDYDGTNIYTVEGNTNTNGSAQGDGVYRQTRQRVSSYVYGYGIPYLDEYLVSADPAWNGKWGGKGAAPAKPVPAPKPVPKPTPVPATPTLSVSHLVAAAKADVPAATGHKSKYAAEVLVLEKALQHVGLLNSAYVDGSFGTKTLTAYRDWQIKCGYTGPDADGYPGVSSLQQLAKKMSGALQFKAGT